MPPTAAGGHVVVADVEPLEPRRREQLHGDCDADLRGAERRRAGVALEQQRGRGQRPRERDDRGGRDERHLHRDHFAGCCDEFGHHFRILRWRQRHGPADRYSSTAASARDAFQLGAESVTAPLTVTPPPPPPPVTLSSLALNPTNVVGPASSTGTVTLSAAAPAGGALVTLSSSNTSVASVAASVTIPGGASSANFTVTASSVTASTPVTIIASLGTVTLTAGLTVAPPAPPPTITRAELNAGQLRLEGSGALPNHSILVDGTALGTSDASGAFKIQVQPFSSPTCVVTVNGGGSS